MTARTNAENSQFDKRKFWEEDCREDTGLRFKH